MIKLTDDINDILDLGYRLATERYYFKLFDIIIEGCIKFTNSDGGTLFLADGAKLRPLISIYKSLDIHTGQGSQQIDVDVDMHAHNLIAYTAAMKKVIRIEDIYNESQFDITRLKNFDKNNSYRTKSIMVVPIFEPGKKVVGVLQLCNCRDDLGLAIPYPKELEFVVSSLTSQMAVTLTNMLLIQDLEELLNSFVESMTTAIDARTPYNANHTVNVANYCMEFVDFINALHTRGEVRQYIPEDDKDQLKMAAMLHDLGKMITPREVLNKATRLGNAYEPMLARLDKIRLLMKIDMLEGRLDNAEWAMEDLRLCNFIAELPGLNIRDRLSDNEVARINEMGSKTYISADGERYPYLTEDESKALNIAKGTLTKEEREIVQQHVVYTDKMLSKIKFNEKYNRVRAIASNHHEYLDGTGYPNNLTADKIDMLTRVLTIADIYDSLTSNDRPYKGIVPVHKALDILLNMADEGKLDKELVHIFVDYCKQKEYEKNQE